VPFVGARARPATFGEFGAALVGEVLTPEFLRDRLNTALNSLLGRAGWLSGFPVGIASAEAGTPRLIGDDGYERRFTFTVYVQLKAGVGGWSLAPGIDSGVEIDLTARIGTFRPATVRLDIDPVTPDDIQLRVNTRGDWLPRSLGDGNDRPWLTRTARPWVPILVLAVNRALESSATEREVDALAEARRSQGVQDTAHAAKPRTGTLAPGGNLRWSIELPEQEEARIQLWAAIDADTHRPGRQRPTGPASSMELTVCDSAGRLVDDLRLTVRRTVPDFDIATTGLTLPATKSDRYQASLHNRGSRPMTYRVEEDRDTVTGERISFADFGEVLIRRGIDRDVVTSAVNRELPRVPEVIFDTATLLRGSVETRLSEVITGSADSGALRFGLLLDLDVEFLLGPGANATVVTTKWQTRLALQVSTSINPATVLGSFEPLSPADVRLVDGPRRLRGRWMPVPRRTLAILVPRHLSNELNRRLDQASRRIVAKELATQQPVGVAEPSHSLRVRSLFSGMASTGRPGQHSIQLAARQRVRARARIVARTPDPTDITDFRPGHFLAELAVCDQHGGVWTADQAALRGNGDQAILRIEFAVPRAGQWTLRISTSRGQGNLEYELRVRPQRR
jgi:hypothetical protein